MGIDATDKKRKQNMRMKVVGLEKIQIPSIRVSTRLLSRHFAGGFSLLIDFRL